MTQPATIGKYVIESILGEGAMGVVYKAFDPIIERPVAIKTIRKQLIETSGAGAAMAARFRNEARAAGRLQHSGIVGIYEYGEDVNEAFIAMEFVEGLSLAQHLANHAVRETFIAPLQINIIMAQLLSALHFAHEQGVWHRDVKPANLIITTDGKLKIADFGIARLDGVHLTQVNSIIGTPTHMAPEQYLGEDLDRRIDIFAAGVVLYQLLTNRLPFTGNQHTLMYKTVNEAHKPPSMADALEAASPGPKRIAEYYDFIMARALAKSPAQRYQTALEFKQALADGARGTAMAQVHSADSEATVMLPAVNVAETQVAAIALTMPSGVRGSMSNTNLQSVFDPAMLSALESTLTRQLGPVAKLLVRRAAQAATDEPSLRALLAEHFTSVQERQAFMVLPFAAKTGLQTTAQTNLQNQTNTAPRAAFGVALGSSSSPAATAMQRTATTMTGATPQMASATNIAIGATNPGLTGGAGLSPELLDKATKALAKHMGPIANVMVRRAASKSPTRAAFCAALCEQLSDAADRQKLAAELDKI